VATRGAGAPRRARVALVPWRGEAEAHVPGALGALTLAADFAWWDDGLADADVVLVLPGDARAPVPVTSTALLDRLKAFARAGGAVLAVGPAVEALFAAGLLPGGAKADDDGPPLGATHVRVEGRATPFSWAIPAGRILPAAGRALRYLASDDDVAALVARGGVILRSCDGAGGARSDVPPAATVAGLCDESGRVVGLLAGASTPGPFDTPLGRQILACLRPRGSGQPPTQARPSATR
jgi:hypothetical protein